MFGLGKKDITKCVVTREEKEDRKLELFDNILFGEKMIARGEATREELQSQFDEIEKELKKLN